MATCAVCGRALPDPLVGCVCGGHPHDAPTLLPGELSLAVGSAPASASVADSAPALEGRFVAGTLVGSGRYRIVGLLGRGGMGEVYKAEDLKLRQVVALKFLPSSLAADRAMLARFHNEVRIARQVAHPNVCRVYDLGEERGLPFLTMELIDGEDLASLLRRIGRLPVDTAVEISLQICAGLSAAHDLGILHRDLKPANVMIDGRGQARITDFGLAVLHTEQRAEDAHAGTPAYMAPELLAGAAASPQSDLFALGLLLFEIFTGKRAFAAGSREELRARHGSPTPSPAVHVPEIDSRVERAILHCLERDPGARPETVAQVALALHGSDALAAALAAGETPSPEMVAAAPATGTLRPALALGALAAIWALLAFFVFQGRTHQVHTRLPLTKAPELLAAGAAELLVSLGFEEKPADRAFGIGIDGSYWTNGDESRDTAEYWKRVESGQPLSLDFWYRQSPAPLVGQRFFAGDVTLTNPPSELPGMVGVLLDVRGRLVELDAVPPRLDEAAGAPGEAPWTKLIEAAGLAPAALVAAPPEWTPPHFADARQAWAGRHPDHPEVPIRVEAAAWHGRPVYFRVIAPWDRPERAALRLTTQRSARASDLLMLALATICAAGGIAFARRNLRLGRGDRRGASKIALVVLVVSAAAMLLRAHHVAALGELTILRDVGGWTLLLAGVSWLGYLALEPFVRRHWPSLLVGWTRLLAGEVRDPMVGRELLAGGLLGLVGHTLMIHLGLELSGRVGTERVVALSPAENWRDLLAFVLGSIPSGILSAFMLLIFMLLVYVLVRRRWLAAGITGVVFYAWLALAFAFAWPIYLVYIVQALCVVMAISRFGLLATVTYLFYFDLSFSLPLTADLSLWYAPTSLAGVGLLVALSGWACRTALGDQAIFSAGLLD